jgi:2-polyprenyl-3-methyl-5-hydroxy-6-metoxy-1,4-benzoquinol methylase
MKIAEAEAFLAAFRDQDAHRLVYKMMTDHYADAILEHHPRPASLDPDHIRNRTRHLCSFLFEEIDRIVDDPSQLSPLLGKMSRGHDPRGEIWFREFNEAYDHYRHRRKLEVKLNQLIPFLAEGDYADIGCGGGDLVCFLKEHYGKFSSYTGIDVMDWRSEAVRDKIHFRVYDFSRPEGALPGRFHFATSMAVLHHVGSNDASLNYFLRNVGKSLHPGGRLLVEEDVILPEEEIEAERMYRVQAEQLKKEQPLFSGFLALDQQQQKHALILIDLLANSLTVGVPDMDFPFGFRTINGWERLFREAGFTVEKIQINGFVGGTFNRSSHVVYLLRKD